MNLRDSVNVVVDVIDSPVMNPWDPYPFILLNLLLSCISAFQAPVIMMAQNRQDARDRTESNYISKIILRNEHQTRHVNAKMDHLLSLQWKRLMEIQELQMFMFQVQQPPGVLSPGSPFLKPRGSTVSHHTALDTSVISETKVDQFTYTLLHIGFNVLLEDEKLLFSRWQLDGDNFLGNISNVRLKLNGLHLDAISFDLTFSVNNATLDDIFSGEKTVLLRNDFDTACMTMGGAYL